MAGAGLDNDSEYGYWLAKAATDIYDIRVVLTRTHKGRD